MKRIAKKKNDYESIPYQGDTRVKRSLRAPNVQEKCSDVDDLSLLVCWPSLMAEVLLLLGEAN